MHACTSATIDSACGTHCYLISYTTVGLEFYVTRCMQLLVNIMYCTGILYIRASSVMGIPCEISKSS